jgi:hypothetical protein
VTSLAKLTGEKLTGDQGVGKMFAILLVALTKDGQTFFKKYLPGGNNTWQCMVYCFEQMLCYWAWLKQDHYWMANNKEACNAATKSIRIMARQLQQLWPRREGLQWALTKLHEMFHVPQDISFVVLRSISAMELFTAVIPSIMESVLIMIGVMSTGRIMMDP